MATHILEFPGANISATELTINNMSVQTLFSLENVTNTGNATPSTVRFTNPTKGFGVTSNIEVGDANLFVDTTTGRVGVGTNAPMGTLDVKGVLNHTQVANVAQITSNSNVVMEYRRSKKLIKYPRVAMTSASSGGYVVTVSSEQVGSEAWHAFDASFVKSNNDHLWTNSTSANYGGTDNTYAGTENLGTGAVNGDWIKLRIPQRIQLDYMRIYNKDQDSTRIVKDFRVYGSNDNLNWTQLLTVTNQTTTFENVFDVNAVGFYEYIALVVTKISGQPNYFRIVELQFFGLPEYDPEAHGTDVVLHTTPNVPNTDWLEVYYDGQDYTSMPATVADKSGNGVTGTPSGGVGFDTTYKAFTFDGVDDQITATDVGFSGEQNLCMSGWLKTNSSGEVANMGIGTYTAARCMFFNVNNSVNSYYIVCNAHNNTYTGTFSPNTWIHVSIVYLGGNISGATLLLYINGELQGPSIGAADTTPLNLPSPCPLNLGKTINGTYKAGSIANFRLYNRALSADEIWELYAYQKEYFGLGDLSMTLKAGRLGIGTSEPRAVLDVRGGLDVTGDVKCDLIRSRAIAFSAEKTGGGDGSTTSYFVANSVHYNYGNGYDASNGRFTAPINGVYHFELSSYTNAGGGTQSRIFIFKNGAYFLQKGDEIDQHGNSISADVLLNAGDIITVGGITDYPFYYYASAVHNHYSGHLVIATG
jgi:hypothetical protein